MFTNLVSAFVSSSEGSFFLFLRRLGDFAGQRIGVRQMVLRAVPVKWLRCTNKTDAAESRAAYHPLRSCLTAGVAAGHVPLRLHTYRTHFLSWLLCSNMHMFLVLLQTMVAACLRTFFLL